MSVRSEIDRITVAKSAIKSAIEAKGVTVPETATLSEYPAKIAEIKTGADLLEVYPVGAIYLSVNSTNPSTLFGGTWQRIQDVFLLAAGSTYSAGSTGGEATHTLTVDEIPSHDHSIGDISKRGVAAGSGVAYCYYKSSTIETSKTGGGAAHNNMPPYLAVYIWKRTA